MTSGSHWKQHDLFLDGLLHISNMLVEHSAQDQRALSTGAVSTTQHRSSESLEDVWLMVRALRKNWLSDGMRLVAADM